MKRIKKIFLVCLLFLVAYTLYTAFSIYTYSKVDEKQSADVAVVLGTAIQGDEPSPVFRERINHGVWLYKNGYVKKVLFTGGKGKGSKHSEASVASAYAIKQGVQKEDILLEERSTITQENILYGAEILEQNEMDTVILVSDPLHMKRAMRMAKDQELVAYSSPTPTTRYRSLKTKIPFLARETFFYIGYILLGSFY